MLEYIKIVAKGEGAADVVAFFLGDEIVCEYCAEAGLPKYLGIVVNTDFVRAMKAWNVVQEMDVREVYADAPECGSCGEKVITEEQYNTELATFK
jgi:hypothetical protein